MKKSTCIGVIFIMAILIGQLIVTEGLAGEKRYTMSGSVTAIEPNYNTVVVEVPLGDRLFTVGGPLSSKAVLRKGGHSVSLSDFDVGDKVTVSWHATDKGHVIDSLIAK